MDHMLSPTPVAGFRRQPGSPQQSSLTYDSPVAPITQWVPSVPDDRVGPVKGAVTGMLLGAGFWTAILVLIFKH